ncbi:MAG: hypothetical protein K6F44_00675 [Lachnospiraceae bacterium]|nr:hypothetical protein [Lachnospiraceae bacterium]
MAAVAFIALCILTGYVISTAVLPEKRAVTDSFSGIPTGLSQLFFRLPLWFVTGTLSLTWLTYILACLFSDQKDPLFLADTIVFASSFATVVFGLIILYRKKRIPFFSEFGKISHNEIISVILVSSVVCYLLYISFHVSGDRLYTGGSVFSDFTPHLSMIRSFSKMNNFPTVYTVVAGDDVKYHFLFEFLVGNLEYLGMRIDIAFNTASALSIISMFGLLYTLAVRITGKKIAGGLTVLFAAFRSSWSFFAFIAGFEDYGSLINGVAENESFIGLTEHEDWGLWNLNVFLNQRHFAFSICIMLVAVMIFLPALQQTFEEMKGKWSFKNYFTVDLFSKKGFAAQEVAAPVFAGIILGASAFFNGAVLVGTFVILFVMAVVSFRRLEYLICAVTALGLSFIQSAVFVNGSVVNTSIKVGFLSESATIFGIGEYLFLLLGILPFVLAAAFVRSDSCGRWMMISAGCLIALSFILSLTPDIAVNHKYIMLAILILDIYAAQFTASLLADKRVLLRISAVILGFFMTATGIFDFATIIKKNTDDKAVVTNMTSKIMKFVHENCDSKDVFLTANYFLDGSDGSYMILSGASLYLAWQYFGWSAGYDTAQRDLVAANIYDAQDAELLKQMVRAAEIDYIVVSSANRSSEDYELNEDMIASVYPEAFSIGEGYDRFTIYKTSDVR